MISTSKRYLGSETPEYARFLQNDYIEHLVQRMLQWLKYRYQLDGKIEFYGAELILGPLEALLQDREDLKDALLWILHERRILETSFHRLRSDYDTLNQSLIDVKRKWKLGNIDWGKIDLEIEED